jgi:uncharacterized membrane protein YphA (DoxX/SURF4 family)
MNTPDIINLIGRVLVAAYFLWATWFNIQAREHHLAEFRRIGWSIGQPTLLIGLVLQAVGSVLLVYTPTAVVGGAMLIVFTLAADALFHRFWTYPDPEAQIIHKFFLYEHLALVGGILGLISSLL